MARPRAPLALLLALSALFARGVHGFGGLLLLAEATGGLAGSEPCPGGQERFTALISGLNNIAPNSTTPLPNLSPVKGSASVCSDATNRRALWTLVLCDFLPITGGYTQAHIHVGARYVDYPPPLVGLEPPVKPADPTAPPIQLPSLPPTTFIGCRKSTGSFGEGDLIPLPPSNLPTVVPVTSWEQLLQKARAGELYVNVHSVRLPTGEARGNLYPN